MARGVRTIRVRFDGDVDALARDAERGKRIIADFGDEAGRRFSVGVERGVNRSLPAQMARAAGRAVTGFGVALQGGALRDPRVAGALGAAVLAGLVVSMPALGSLAAGLFVGAFGSGLAGLGLVFAAQSKFVKDSFSAVAKETAKTLRLMTAPLRPVLVSMIGQFQAFFGAISADLQNAFARMAGPLEEFTDHLFTALGPEGLGAIIGPVTDAFIAMLDALGPELPGIMKGLADAIINVADSIKENPDTFASLVKFLFQVIEGALNFVAALSRVANWFEEHPEVTGPLIEALKACLFPLQLLRGSFKLWQTIVDLTTRDAGNSVSNATLAMRNAFGRISEIVDKVDRWFREMGVAIVKHMNAAINYVQGIPGKIRRAFGNPGRMLEGVGRAIMAGLAGGIRAAAGQAADAAVQAARDAVNAAKRWLGVGSPSKLAADQIGAPIGQGIAVGMQRTRGLVERTGRRVAGAAVPNATGGSGITVENLHVRAFSDRFSLSQIQDELALHGAA